MSNKTKIILPTVAKQNPLHCNDATVSKFRITFDAFQNADSQTLFFPPKQGTGFVYHNGNNKLSWRTSTAPVEYKDDVFRITNATKQIAFDASLISDLTTRTINMPNTNIDLTVVDNLKNLTTFEISQLENINTLVIPTTHWDYLSLFDQSVDQIAGVTFNTLNAASTLISTSIPTKFQVGTTSGTSQSQIWFTGSVDPDPDNDLGGYSGLGPICRLGSAQVIGDSQNIISEGFQTYGTSSYLGQMTSNDNSTGNLKPQAINIQETFGGVTSNTLLVNSSGIAWRNPGMLTDLCALDSTMLTLNTALMSQSTLRLTALGTNWVALESNPASTYSVPYPVDAPSVLSRMLTDGATSSWIEYGHQPLINLYTYPTTYSISGGGAALQTAVALNGGGTVGNPNVYEITDSLTYTAGIDLTNKSYIIIRGAAGQRPVIATDAANPNGFYIIYGVATGQTTDVMIGNLDIDVTGPGLIDQMGIMCWKQNVAALTDAIGQIAVKDVLFVNTDYVTPAISRGGLIVLDETGEGGFWMDQLYVENCVFKDLTARTDRGALMLMGIANYVGQFNSHLYPNQTTWNLNMSRNYYWIRGSNVKEVRSYISQGSYSANSTSRRYLVKISQDYLYSSWANTCLVEFQECSFSNNVESATGAVILSHDPTGTPGAALQPITLSVKSCLFTDIKGAGVLLKSDGVNHGDLVTLAVEDNQFVRCECGISQDSSYVSGFAAISVERNTYDACLQMDTGFSSSIPLQQAVGKDLMAYSSMYRYFDQVDYTLWSQSSTAYFVTTASFPVGIWYMMTLLDGLPAVGWSLGPSNRIDQDGSLGMFTILEDGLYEISFSVNMINTEATVQQWEAYVVIDGETPPSGAPSGDQLYKICPSLQLSTGGTATQISACQGEVLIPLRSQQTVQLAVRWVSGGGLLPLQYYIQSVKVDIMKMSI